MTLWRWLRTTMPGRSVKFRRIKLDAHFYTIPVKEVGGCFVCKGDGDFIATVLKTAIADVFPGSFKQSITMLIKCKPWDQNVSDHAAT
jgi:hypothetical protein